MSNNKFKNFYNGPLSSLEEDEFVYKALKRQITAYIRESTFERLHGIFNKIYILRQFFDKEKFYDIILEDMNTEKKEVFINFILKEGFKFEKEPIKEEIWEYQLKKILSKYGKN